MKMVATNKNRVKIPCSLSIEWQRRLDPRQGQLQWGMWGREIGEEEHIDYWLSKVTIKAHMLL